MICCPKSNMRKFKIKKLEPGKHASKIASPKLATPKKKTKKRSSFNVKKPTFLALALSTSIFGTIVGIDKFFDTYDLQFQSPIVFQTPILIDYRNHDIISGVPYAQAKEPTPTPTNAPEPTKQPRKSKMWEGKVSYYSHDGCLGCHPQQITASGQPFDENALTLAFNHLPMLTRVKVTNLDNGLNAEAIVNDTGGFEKYNRIADLSKALYELLDAQTDQSNIRIEVL